MQDNNISIQKTIKKLIESDISAYQVAKETGIPQNTVYRIFSGESKIENITLKNAEILAAYYKSVSLEE